MLLVRSPPPHPPAVAVIVGGVARLFDLEEPKTVRKFPDFALPFPITSFGSPFGLATMALQQLPLAAF
jgi:hypothetical protein